MQKILDKIKPSKEETNQIKKLSNEIISKIKIKDAKVILGGSGAKDTWLKETHDVDLYARFNYQKYKDSKNISKILKTSLEKKFKIKKLHGSRDYFQIKKNNITFEIIPILEIKKASQAKNITDISPLHAIYVKKHKKSDEIRLTKAFTKANNIYGAETHIRGLSGYAIEILTIYYKTFKNFMKAASKWKKRTILDPEKHLKNPLKELNKSKLNSPLILIDPVDKTRNVTAVLSQEKYDQFINLCKQFTKNPSDKFFIKKEEKIPKGSIILKFPVKGKSDIIGGKYYGHFNKLKKQLMLYDFKIDKSGFILDNEAILYFKLKSNTLPSKIKVRGPPVKNTKHFTRFKKKHKKVSIVKGISYSIDKRKYTNAKLLLKALTKQI